MKVANKISLSFFITAILLTSISISIIYITVKSRIKEQIFDQLISVAQSRAYHVESFLEEQKEEVELAKRNFAFKELLITPKNDPSYNQILEQTILVFRSNINNKFHESFLLDKNGTIVSSVNRGSIGHDKSNDPYFLNAKEESYIKDMYYSTTAEKNSMAVSSPIIDDKTNQLLGVIVLRIETNELDHITSDRTGLGETGEIYLVNKDYYMITSSRFNEDSVLKQKVDTVNVRNSFLHMRGQKSEQKKIENFLNYRGINVVGTYVYIPETKWALLAEINAKEAFEPLRWIRIVFVAILILVPLIAWIVGIFVSRLISESIHKLHKGTEIIASGNLDYKIGLDTKDEIGQLSRAFDKMTENLKNKTASVIELNNEIFQRQKAEEALQRAKMEAEMANEAKSEFLANMSHEIRTPLNAIIGFSDFLQETDLDESQAEYSRIIKSSGDALLLVIDDILDFSKIESGKLDFERIDFDPEILVYDVCDVIRPRIGTKPIEIMCHIGDNIPAHLNGDPARFRQVLTNLMGNASKFTDKGEIEISLDVETEKVDQVKLHLLIRDTGIGIPKDKLKTIFEPFHQADSSTTRRYGGTGLGLPICRKISNLMDGDVWAESKDNKGTIFHFTAWFKKVEEKEVKRFTPISLSGKKILIVDDTQRNLDILAHLLNSVGMEVVALKNSREVISTLHKNLKAQDPFILCIMDIQMPDMSGYEVAMQIRNSETEIRRLPLIALSSLMDRNAIKCKEAGFAGFLSKPIRREKLFQMLEYILEAKEGEEEKSDVIESKFFTQYSVREEIKHSVKILLAEDNLINQKLATRMLTKAGYQVEVAENGNEVVEKYMANPSGFNLIFMDVQMPEMDGMEATQKIRSHELEELAVNPTSAIRIPIIAMTANAMKGDRKKCLEIGMDDYISKPIKREIVFDILKKWVFK
ncbi:MAG: response regulator [Candidatus Aminicenantes bacterium]|nr:response regulator [Candidatus Aminicenantes bacterium]